jgi:hypothetical protein
VRRQFAALGYGAALARDEAGENPGRNDAGDGCDSIAFPLLAKIPVQANPPPGNFDILEVDLHLPRLAERALVGEPSDPAHCAAASRDDHVSAQQDVLHHGQVECVSL